MRFYLKSISLITYFACFLAADLIPTNNLNNYEIYKDIDNSKIWNDFLKLHNTYINKWINHCDILYLEDCDKML